MMTASTKVPIDRWAIESLRVTVFASGLKPLVPGAWKSIAGDDPETTASQPKLGVAQEQGPIPAGILVVQQSPDRIDVVLAPPPHEPTQLPSLGTFREAFAVFTKLLEKWLAGMSGPFDRIALGVATRLPVSSKEDGYAQLGAYLPFAPDPKSSDLVYQINRRRKSSDGFLVNRLSKWSVNFAQSISFRPMSLSEISFQDLRHMCRIELDLNSAPETPLQASGGKLAKILEEFGSMAEEIILKGDVP